MALLRNTAITAAAAFIAAATMTSEARAALLDFTFTSAPIGGLGAGSTGFVADEINQSTVALVTQTTATSQTENGFAQVNTFLNNGGLVSQTGGLNSNYGVYALYTTTANVNCFTPGCSGPITSFNFTLWADIGNNDTFNGVGSAAPGTVTNTAGDVQLASGTLVPGSNNTAGFNSNGGPAINVLTTFNLTAVGATVFTAPVPFYSFEFSATTSSQSGNITPGPGANQVQISSIIDSSFVVPEPSTLSLLGMGLLAFGALTRRRARRRLQS